MKVGSFARTTLAALALVLASGVVALGDVIRMKDGQVIRGQIVAFRDQQFTILIGSGARGRRSQMTVYMEDVESIEFEAAGAATTTGPAPDTSDAAEPARPQPQPTNTTRPAPPTLGGRDTGRDNTSAPPDAARDTGAASRPAPAAGNSSLIPVRVRVRADAASNGWTDSGLMVRRGQRLRITAAGRVSLGQGRFSTPTGLPRVVDTEKLMRDKPTGALIAVVGDDNDEFIFVGSAYEFYATRDGRLFLGVNEGNLEDNTGTYDALVEIEPAASGGDE
ncbi:MAG TPA: hypothetical protein VFZ44_00100 [Pyrinomonadaceae bacterium]